MLYAINKDGHICQVSFCVGENIVTKLYAGRKQAYNNYQLENNAVRIYNKNKYESGAANMTEADSSTLVANKYIYAGSASLTVGKWSSGISVTDGVGQKRLLNDCNSYLFVNNIIDSSHKFVFSSPAVPATNLSPTNLSRATDSSYNCGQLAPEKGNRYWYQLDPVISTQAQYGSPVLVKTKKTGTNEVGTTIQFFVSDNSTKAVYSTAVKGRVTPIYNLIPGATYFYKVLNSSSKVIRSGSFKTEGQIRQFKLSGVCNARDCGGWKTTDGKKRIKYGVLLRGSELESGDMVPGATSSDLAELRGNLNIGAEVELRGSSYSSKTHIVTPTYLATTTSDSVFSYGKIVTESDGYKQFAKLLKTVINTALNSKATYVHCQQGRDRTGSFIAILMALLGIHDDGILKDYELSTFFVQETTRYGLCVSIQDTTVRDSTTRRTTKAKFSGTRTFASMSNGGSTVQEKAQNWFKNKYGGELDSLYTGTGRKWTNSTTNKTKAADIIKFAQEVLLESTSSAPVPPQISDTNLPVPNENEGTTLVNVIVGKYQIAGLSNGTWEGWYYKSDTSYKATHHYEFPISKGDTIVVKMKGWDHHYMTFVETQGGLYDKLLSVKKSIYYKKANQYLYTNSAYTKSLGIKATANCTMYACGADSNSKYPYGNKAKNNRYSGTGERWYTYTHHAQTDGGKLLISYANNDDTINDSSDSKTILFGIYLNGSLIYGTNVSFGNYE